MANETGETGETGDGERSLWQLSRDEQRMLVITFVGGLASIVVGAAIIGASLALARQEARVGVDPLSTAILVAALVLGSLAVGIKRVREFGGPSRPWVAFMLLSLFLGWTFLVLWLVGIAAGIH